MDNKPIVLHVHPGASSFVVKDRRLLSAHFHVKDAPFLWRAKWQVPVLMLKQFLRSLFTRWEIAVVQFGGYHALLPALLARVLGRPCIIITGGTDCVSFPSLSYGNFARQPLAFITRTAYRLCAHIAPVHASLVRSHNNYQQEDDPEQGLFAHMPGLRTSITVVHNGFDADAWTIGDKSLLPDIDVLTVASGDRRPSTMMLKGIDVLVEAARSLPHLRFVIIGLHGTPPDGTPDNVRFIPPVENSALIGYYQRSHIYAQLSLSEGFPNALCEAMLCGCLPLVSEVGAMPDIVADTGAIVKTRSSAAVAGHIGQLLVIAAGGRAMAARERIAGHYTEERRAEELSALIFSTLKNGRSFSGG